MKKSTEYALKAAIPVIGVCVPIVVVMNIYQTGNYWTLIYLIWAAGLILWAIALLGQRR